MAELEAAKESLIRHLGHLAKSGSKTPKGYKGQASKPSEGNRPGVKPIWRETWKRFDFPLNFTKPQNNSVSPVRDGINPSAKSWGLGGGGRGSSCPSHSLQPSAATQTRGPGIVRLMGFFSREARNPDFNVKIWFLKAL